MSIYKNTLTEIIKGKNSWNELKEEISKYNIQDSVTGKKDTSAGKIFEVFTQYYFLVSPTEKDNFKNAWLFEEIPLQVRLKLNLGNIDHGVDLVLEDNEGKYFVVQCKFKNDESSSLNWSSNKIANLFGSCPNADGFIVFTNAADLDNHSKTRYNNFTFYSIANLIEIESKTLLNIYNSLLGEKTQETNLFTPKPHQEIAIEKCITSFETENRGQLILPCGAGKTLTALWIKERLCCKHTLVLVPSLALLRQIKNDWAKQRSSKYHYICVCSETNIDADTDDTLIAHAYEIDVHVTTSPDAIKNFLEKDYPEKVIFSTYHSLEAVSEAIHKMDSEFEFDFIFCDEAHKTAGIGMNKFSLIHNNQKIPAKRRLYATATPRIVKESLKKKLDEELKYAYDMNDPEIFGHEFYRMTFKEAIETGILVDYKIIAIGVNSEELKEYIDKRRFIDSKQSIDELANNYALEQIMQKYKANHALTFHSRVKLAEEFSDRHSKLFDSVNSYSVSGEQPTSYRNTVLNNFKNSNKAVISNARCLTEGVDVPTIDLVYFCDPKNSKVDIVQAVGRALRKKENKEIGLVVVPVYHTTKEKVEDSITASSFRNLLQVIRSLCDQDERLQDEINSLAYSKGKKSSSKIDFTFTNYETNEDVIFLEGFEEKLKESLFDQIIDKTSNNWDLWFIQFKEYLDTNKEYPTEKDDIELYRWVAQQRNRKKNNILKNEEIRKLDEIGFIWNKQEMVWETMYSKLVEYSKNNDFQPYKENEPELSKWYRVQQSHIKSDKLREDRKIRIEAIKFIGSASRNKWIPIYDELVKFRQDNPNRWPTYDRKNPNSKESKLNNFCYQIRQRFKNNDLEDFWFDKMAELNFNFEGHADNWLNYFEEVKNLIIGKDSISISEIGEKAYSWISRHKRLYEEGSLTKNKAEKIQKLNLDKYFQTWEDIFSRVNNWVIEKGKLPTYNSNKELNTWLMSQRIKYKNGTLPENQVLQLQSINFDLEGKGNEKKEEKWNIRLNEYKEFLSNFNREPSYFGNEFEKTLYLWAAAQRAVKAGTARKRKPLSKAREDALNEINFNWIGEGNSNKSWEESLEDFIKYIEPNGELTIPSNINGKRNILYTWWMNQKIAFEKGELAEDRIKAFEELGINLNSISNTSTADGFTNWARGLYKINEFIQSNGHYPKSNKDKIQHNLYHSLARTKRAYKSNKLTEKQIKLIKELNIELD